MGIGFVIYPQGEESCIGDDSYLLDLLHLVYSWLTPRQPRPQSRRIKPQNPTTSSNIPNKQGSDLSLRFSTAVRFLTSCFVSIFIRASFSHLNDSLYENPAQPPIPSEARVRRWSLGRRLLRWYGGRSQPSRLSWIFHLS